MGLITLGDFTSHSGLQLPFKIECDALTDDDMEAIASIISKSFAFGSVHGIPRGGLRLAQKLTRYVGDIRLPALIVDDVLTTGTSMIEYGNSRAIRRPYIGVVIFARGPCPSWVHPIFRVGRPWVLE